MPTRSKSNTNATLYQGIVDDVRHMVDRRQLTSGDRLPSMDKLAEKYNVSVITAKRAISELQQLGLVKSVRGKGSFIAGGTRKASATDSKPLPLKTVTLLTINADAKNTRSFLSSIWMNIQSYAEEKGLSFRVQVMPDGGSDFHVDMQFNREPDEGIILLAPAYPYRVLTNFEDRTFRAVLIDSALSFSHSVLTDNMDGIDQLLKHHMGNGHEHILLASRHPRSPNPTNENEREAAFQFLAKQHGIQHDVVPAAETDTILQKIKNKGGPTAVMFTQDEPAMDFLDFARSKGMDIPKQASVSGFDGWVNFRDKSPELTTLEVDRVGLGKAAVDLLCSLTGQGKRVPKWIRVPGHLTVAQSTGKANVS